MTTKVVYAEVVDGRLILPPEAHAILPSGIPLYMVVDEDKERITVYAKDLKKQLDQSQGLMDALADMNADLTKEEYTRTFSEAELRRQNGDAEDADR